MPEPNQFRHQPYPTVPETPPRFSTLELTGAEDGEYFSLHATAQIARVILIHGTFVGEDPIGISEILSALADGTPFLAETLRALSTRLRQQMPAITESALGDIGNFTTEFRDTFQKAVGDDPQIELLTPRWTSQNHHFARADLAIRLISQLLERPLPNGQRVVFWGHSHAGNACALMTNLLANDRESVLQFFDAAENPDTPHWRLVRESLMNSGTPHPLAQSVDIVNFETPVRYGWDVSGCRRLIHVTFHRPQPGIPAELTKPLSPPWTPSEILSARYGDWVQAMAVAGTDVSTPATRSVNERLGKFLERNLPLIPAPAGWTLMPQRIRETSERWKAGTRCHDKGINLLVDYQLSGLKTKLGTAIEHSLFGHGVATTIAWLPAHLRLVSEWLQT